ncbi:hypothetical protein JXB02_01375 [Candidatus Woesearchaeota archaeon]|nr:hypothetical protein [Candidatus Woesearchaeota archaeon]
MRLQLRKGLGFGLTSGIITTLGLIVGLEAGTGSRTVVLGGILVIAVADALSDALGIHISEEAENRHTVAEVWEATLATLLSKFFVALTFAVPVWLLADGTAILASVVWGLFLMTVINWYVAMKGKEAPWKVIGEHLLIAVLVIAVTYAIGSWVATLG